MIIKKPKLASVNEEFEKNVSEKSIIFAPFNSSFSQFNEDQPELFDWPASVKELLQPKKSKILTFSKKCKDLNREYESNNNADLDNGVYNAFVNEQEAEAEKLLNQQIPQEEDKNQNVSFNVTTSFSSDGDSGLFSL